MSPKPLPEPAGPPSVLIVGAGMAGLMLASSLPEFGHRISLVDKGRSVGGRLATRRFGACRADHGAQFFSVRTPEFATWVERWQGEGLVYAWAEGWGDGSLDAAEGGGDHGHTRYAVREGMSALARRLAQEVSLRGAAVHTDTRLRAVKHTERGWWSMSADGRVYMGNALVLTCPVPQALALLREGQVALAPDDLAQLCAIAYAPCLCLMLRVAGRPRLPATGAVQRPGAVVTWLADNRRKGLASQVEGAPADETVVTLHASPEFSADHLADDDAAVAAALEADAREFLAGCTVLQRQVKRWRYARPLAPQPAAFLRAAGLPPLFFAGDAFGGARVEGAALSGMATAAALRAILD